MNSQNLFYDILLYSENITLIYPGDSNLLLLPLQCLNIQNEKDGLENTVFQ